MKPMRTSSMCQYSQLVCLDSTHSQPKPADKISLEQLQSVLHRIEQPVFRCVLNEVEHRYFRGDKIKTWKLKY